MSNWSFMINKPPSEIPPLIVEQKKMSNWSFIFRQPPPEIPSLILEQKKK